MRPVHGVDGAARRALMFRAACTSVLLSMLFVIVYGSTNWFTAQRPGADVQTWSFAWEPVLIPYAPIMIVPYMSMDLFFFFAPFLCQDRRALRTFTKRVVFSILVAAAFFLLMPLRLEWPARPRVEGWFGAFVEQSCTAPFLMEYPHNLFPSLHIVLCLIVADVYLRRTSGFVRLLLGVWFFWIGAATVLTWQHHVVDILGGVVLSSFAFYCFRECGQRNSTTPNPRIGGFYAAGAALLLTLALVLLPWGAFLLWPTAALAITAAGYFGLGPGIFRKTNGRLPWSTCIVMAPILIGHYLSLLYYRRQCRAWDEVLPGVLIGRALTDDEAAEALAQGVTATLDLTAEFAEAAPFRAGIYRSIPILDLTAPTPVQLQEAIAFIAHERVLGVVYVHCKIGYSRSAAVVAAYLLASGLVDTIEEAIDVMRQARPAIVIRSEVIDALRVFARFTDFSLQSTSSAA